MMAGVARGEEKPVSLVHANDPLEIFKSFNSEHPLESLFSHDARITSNRRMIFRYPKHR